MPNVNHKITAQEVRVLGNDGEMLGVMSIRDALRVANEKELDLIEISPTANPPVCKIMDFSKYKYDLQKKASATSSSSKKMKEIKLGVSIGKHDLEIKLKHAIDFLEAGHTLRLTAQMKGRENSKRDIAIALVQDIVLKLSEYGKTQDKISAVGNQIVVTFFPSKTKKNEE